MKRTLFFLSMICSLTGYTANVDTVSVYSASMKRSYKCVVITPEIQKGKSMLFPTVYLLHGYSGSYSNWIRRVPQLKEYADKYQMLVVCPDGAFSSWYIDSPVDSSIRFETYIAKELPQFIESKYPVIQDRKARAITGLSMGGHGGLFLGFRHASYFGACGSMSGALVIEYITRGYDMEKRLGDTTNKERYRAHSIMKQMESYPKDSIAVIIDCGTEDFIIEMSRQVHQKMLQLKIPHDYIERPGKHDWNYWANAVQYQLLYFRNFFNRDNN